MMASDDKYDVEDITPSNSPGNESDEEDDDDDDFRPAGRRIAHKEMKNIDEEEVETGGEKKESKDIEDAPASKDASFEDISEDEGNAALSAGEGDSENEQPFSPPPEEDSYAPDKDSDLSENGESLQVEDSKHFSGDEDNGDNEEVPANIARETDEKQDAGNADFIDAPIPSPFSDIGDITGAENAMITDILNETSQSDHISPELEGFAHSLESTDVSLPVPSLKDDVDDKEGSNSLEPLRSPIESKKSVNENENEKADDKVEGATELVPEGQEQGGGDVGGLIADIFGDSDEEDEEFEGFGEEELKTERMKLKNRAIISDHDEDSDNEVADSEKSGTALEVEKSNEAEQEIGTVPMPADEESSDDERPSDRPEMISDFDLMMQRKKEAMSSRRRGKRDFEIINDNDDIIAAMIRNMKEAAEEDRLLNQAGRAATKKMKMLESVVSHLNKADLQHTFIDGGVLPVMKEWLTPLPDNSLPHIMIRKKFLKLLSEFPALDTGALKMSGIGRAVMLLYKHPKEARENRDLAGKIVAQWARPIFGVQTNFKDVSREEREERDKMNAVEHKKRRLSSADDHNGDGSLDEKKPRRPGDKGFVARARVPRPSTRDYVIRPRSDVGSLGDMGGLKNSKKSLDRFEKQMRKFKDRKKGLGSASKAVSISINGSKMAL